MLLIPPLIPSPPSPSTSFHSRRAVSIPYSPPPRALKMLQPLCVQRISLKSKTHFQETHRYINESFVPMPHTYLVLNTLPLFSSLPFPHHPPLTTPPHLLTSPYSNLQPKEIHVKLCFGASYAHEFLTKGLGLAEDKKVTIQKEVGLLNTATITTITIATATTINMSPFR